MATRININADMGEGYGKYDIGDDEGILGIVNSVNVACGFHAGDPTVMRRVCTRAAALGVSIGAHPGFNDLWGFGRRQIEMDPVDLENMVAYQIGGLKAMAASAGTEVTHVKPHGALNNMAAVRADYALAIGRAISTVDPALHYVALSGSEMEKAALELGLPLCREAFVDREYDSDGNLRSRRKPDSMIKDPQRAAERVVRMVLDETIVSIDGKPMPTRFDTLCVHGDEPTAIAVARACRDALVAAGIALLPIPDLMAAR